MASQIKKKFHPIKPFNLPHTFYTGLALVCLLLFTVGTAGAADIEQTLTLRPGWNAVFLEVDPVSSNCADVFASLNDLISVWTWNPRLAALEFIQDPDTLVPDTPDWLSYFPDDPVLTTLYAVYGERPYLIKIGGTAEITWTVIGTPRLPRIKWKQDAFNLVGFHLAADDEPFFEDFFSTSPAHAGQDILVLNDAGRWQKVENPALTRMKQGEAFWVFCRGYSDFTGTLALETRLSGGVTFGQRSNEQWIDLANTAAADAAVSVTLSGSMPLFYRVHDSAAGNTAWQTLPLDTSLDAGSKKNIRLGVRRAGLTPGSVYEANLEVFSDTGMRIVVPASVQGISHTGLWVGTAVVNKINDARVDPDAQFPLVDENQDGYAAASNFTFRLIVHVDSGNNATLLRQVVRMWDDTEQGYVLFSDQARTAQYTPTDQSVRISSAAFGQLVAPTPGVNTPERYPPGPPDPGDPPGQEPMTLSGPFGELGSALNCSIMVSREDPMNPFRHRYHPDHKDTEDAFDVIRDIELVFATNDSDGNPISGTSGLGWGGGDMGGIFRETFTGLHRSPIKVEGSFLLKRVSDIGVLQ